MSDFKHNDGSLTNQKDRQHESGLMEPMCWCLPVRTRLNGLTQMYEIWDRDKFEWVIDPDAEQPKAIDQLPDDGGIAPMPRPDNERREIPEPTLRNT